MNGSVLGVRVKLRALAGDDAGEREQGHDDLQESDAVAFGDFGPVHEGFLCVAWGMMREELGARMDIFVRC